MSKAAADDLTNEGHQQQGQEYRFLVHVVRKHEEGHADRCKA